LAGFVTGCDGDIGAQIAVGDAAGNLDRQRKISS